MSQPSIVKILPPDQIDRQLETARCAAPSLPSDLACVAAIMVQSRPARGRVIATWRWHRAHGRACAARTRN